jgi:hypothetical protein
MKKVNLNEIPWRERKSSEGKDHHRTGVWFRFRRMTRLVVLCGCAVAGVVLAGVACKSSSSDGGIQPTPSGPPEITIRANTEAEVKRVAVEFFLQRGYAEIRSQYVNEVAFDKETKKSGRSARALRVRLRIHKQSGGNWRVVGTPLGVDEWHTDLEAETVLLEGASQIQGFLAEIKTRVESTDR